MKSYFLEGVRGRAETEAALSELLPGQTDPWILWHVPGDPIAYLSIGEERNALYVQADISGRHCRQDDTVVDVLRELQRRVGGIVGRD
ncbi:hypothetical protein K4L06_05815 [Lysobacter sp. BMK333-48F3]|uniref:hypothetical protein n=1 Tax=Lysobacter sp. BMK333-48F3 TaxID=2867962 RepID=UPI001C8C94EE|nr:hypothetical protein [Lysobacter sp. BMK333-48F3]MBX9400822.1 hypothetical protein [Lysobacter sp. BMK333-48F3]